MENETHEKRWTPEEFKEQLFEFYEREPARMNAQDFENHLEHTTAYRYEKGSALVDEVQKFLEEIAINGNQCDAESKVMVDKLNKAVVAFGYGAVRYNSTLQAGATSRPEPWGSKIDKDEK